MIAEITVDITPKGAKRHKSMDVPFFFDVNTDVKFSYPIDNGRYMRTKIDGEIFDIITTDELLDSLARKFEAPTKIGYGTEFKSENLNKKKRTPKKKVRQS